MSTPTRPARGMTLIEVTVTLGLLILAAGSLFWILYAGKSAWQAKASRASVRQDLQTAMARIADELRNSDAGLITNGTAGTPVAFSFPSAVSAATDTFVTDGSGALTWQMFVIYYVPTGTTRLLRKTIPATGTVVALTAANLRAYCDGNGALVASSVTALTLTPDAAQQAATLSINVQSTGLNGKIDSLSATQVIKVRN
jgi:Tfp pilus assembly protein PilW